MSKASHTPTTEGAWVFEPHGAFGTDFLGEDWPLGYISREVPRTPIFALGPVLELPTDELLASARIMAAGKEMLAALVELERVYETGDFETEFRPALDRARAAIAKATGEAA
ncbi:hypothetical protein [Sphingobium sp. DC-2]|uniref:hypothetical protein n=1 Tax=Sphingobium sp. DC-2 TaxID=1303256 RepID=UPI0004C3B94D|nr:hypothetical protein [Sphingobium sp. DC-2]